MAAVADTAVVVDISEAAVAVAMWAVATPSTSAATISPTSAADMLRLDTSFHGMDRAYTSDLDFMAVYSRVDTGPISGTAVGGITASARAGYGRTITVSTCGPAIKVLQRY